MTEKKEPIVAEKKEEVKEAVVEKEDLILDGRYVAKKIHALRSKVDKVKASKMNAGGLHYNYLSENELTNTLRPIMQELGLVMYPCSLNSSTRVFNVGKDRNGEDRQVLLSDVCASYTIVDVETGDRICIDSVGSGADTMDKGINKANTCAFKNVLRSIGMFPSPDRDDPDTSPSSSGSSNSNSNLGSLVLKYGPHAGKTLQDLFDEDPEEVEKLASGKSKWLADKATAFLESMK